MWRVGMDKGYIFTEINVAWVHDTNYTLCITHLIWLMWSNISAIIFLQSTYLLKVWKKQIGVT